MDDDAPEPTLAAMVSGDEPARDRAKPFRTRITVEFSGRNRDLVWDAAKRQGVGPVTFARRAILAAATADGGE